MSYNLTDEILKCVPYDDRETECIKKVLEFLKTGNNVFDRSNKYGHITAGAIVADRKGNVLLNHHKITQMWFGFGGHSDGNSNSLEVAKREVMEESGITEYEIYQNKIFDVDLQVIKENKKRNEPEHYHFDINYLFLVDSHDFKISDESLDIKWFSLEDAISIVSSDDYGMQRMLSKYKDFIQKQM